MTYLMILFLLFLLGRESCGFVISPSQRKKLIHKNNNKICLNVAKVPEGSTSKISIQQQENVVLSKEDDEEEENPVVTTDNDVLSMPPFEIDIVRQEKPKGTKQADFVKMFRDSANYVANHRNTISVYHIPGALLEQTENFKNLMNDIAITWLLGMKIVLVVGCQYQIDRRLAGEKSLLQNTSSENNNNTTMDDITFNVGVYRGISVTDEDTLRIAKEEAGYVRFEVERQLARSLRLHGLLQDEQEGSSSEGNVVSGNFFSAQPFGVLNGTDYQFTGLVRRIEVEKVTKVFDAGDICLLTPLGVSPSGEVFYVNSQALAASVAGSLGASKMIFFTRQNMILKSKTHGQQVQSLRLSDARNLLQHWGITNLHKRGTIQFQQQQQDSMDENKLNTIIKLGWATVSLDQGVKRAHILAPIKGALLQELYTRDGSGTLISRDLYDGIRRAGLDDIMGIYDLISPLVKMGTLVERPKAQLEKHVQEYYVYTRDDLVVACGQLKFHDGEDEDGRFGEIGCLVVRKEYRSSGRGDSMLCFLERLCLRAGASNVFVLSTQTMEWFIERGFREVKVDQLPPSRRETYNKSRASKIYMKHIDDRDLDASELWWNR